MTIAVAEHAFADVDDSRVSGHVAVATTAETSNGIAVELDAGDPGFEECAGCGGTVWFFRNRVLDNRLDGPDSHAAFQLAVNGGREASLRLGSSLVAGGDASGVYAFGREAATIDLDNLTIASHDGLGLLIGKEATASGVVSLANSVVAANGGGDVEHPTGDVVETANTIGGDPLFVDPSARNYHLRIGSPAIDSGSSTALGDPGPLDLDKRPRVVGPSIDRGAYELQSSGPRPGSSGGQCVIFDRPIFAPLLVDSTTGICRCVGNPDLHQFRCAFFARDLFVNVTLPTLLLPGQPFEASWSGPAPLTSSNPGS